MFETIIKENLISNHDINLLCNSFKDLDFTLNPSAKEDNYSALYTYPVDHGYQFLNITEKIDSLILNNIEYFYRCRVKSFTGKCIVKYSENQFINLHKDWEPEDDWVIKNNKDTVHISSVFYFNDNYDGGELLFHPENNKNTKNTIIKPKPNLLILFDALQIHSTNPIISGIKYSYTNFYTLEG
jgi:hypothetical protein